MSTYPPLGKMINILSRHYQQHMAQALKPLGLSTSVYPVLLKIDEEPGISVNDIAKRAVINKSIVSKAIQWLQAQGHIVIEADQSHRQRMAITLAPSGKAMIGTIRSAVKAFEHKVLSDIPKQDIQHLLRVLSLIYLQGD